MLIISKSIDFTLRGDLGILCPRYPVRNFTRVESLRITALSQWQLSCDLQARYTLSQTPLGATRLGAWKHLDNCKLSVWGTLESRG